MIKETRTGAIPTSWLIVAVPLPELLKEVNSWLRAERGRVELKLAEGLAMKEFIRRAKTDTHNC